MASQVFYVLNSGQSIGRRQKKIYYTTPEGKELITKKQVETYLKSYNWILKKNGNVRYIIVPEGVNRVSKDFQKKFPNAKISSLDHISSQLDEQNDSTTMSDQSFQPDDEKNCIESLDVNVGNLMSFAGRFHLYGVPKTQNIEVLHEEPNAVNRISLLLGDVSSEEKYELLMKKSIELRNAKTVNLLMRDVFKRKTIAAIKAPSFGASSVMFSLYKTTSFSTLRFVVEWDVCKEVHDLFNVPSQPYFEKHEPKEADAPRHRFTLYALGKLPNFNTLFPFGAFGIFPIRAEEFDLTQLEFDIPTEHLDEACQILKKQGFQERKLLY